MRINRYSYASNSPLNFTDPTGHCINNYESGSDDMDTCIAGWNAVVNYLAGAAYGPGGSGEFPNATVADWLMNADISTLEKLMGSYAIGYGYTWTPPQGYFTSGWRGGTDLKSPAARAGVCQYWQGCYEPALTSQEIPPDAFLFPGFSLSAARVWYETAGVELISNRVSNENSWFSYHGQGSGVAIEAIGAFYGGLVWNLEQNRDYEGVFAVLTVDGAYYLGIKGSLFWEAGTLPFSGETWGVAIGPSGGGGAGATMSYADYTCERGCSR